MSPATPQTTNLQTVIRRSPWLFSCPVDLAAFLGSAVLALGLLAVGKPLGLLHADSPEWTWVTAVLLIDVAHVYATGFRVYFVREELHRRTWLYTLAPLLSFLIGLAVYSESPAVFWRLLAYLAVLHFVRQQAGWVSLYRTRGNEREPIGRWIDTLAIYLATVYPLVHWHAHLPRDFWWFREHDFAPVPSLLVVGITPVYWLTMVAYAGRSVWRGVARQEWNIGKDIVVISTALCWYLGIITFNSDYAFTVTNVIIHGVPYMVLVYWYRWHRSGFRRTRGKLVSRPAAFVGLIWVLAYVEEMLWDRGVWHEREWLFGSAWYLGRIELLLVPLLAVPQLTHYILDGFIWRRRSNHGFAEMLLQQGSSE